MTHEARQLLRREYANRGFALACAARLARSVRRPEQRAFWEAFLALEQHSRARYAAVAPRMGIDLGAVKAGRVRVALAVGTLRFVTGPTMRGFLRSTRSYLARLERLRTLAGSSDPAFFDYVVAQEAVQVEALEHIVAGAWGEATAAVQRFVAGLTPPDP